MTEFENNLILQDVPFKAGLFPQIPNYRKAGSAFILAEGADNDILVSAKTTARDLRVGKYTRLVEISTHPYTKEIEFTAASKEGAYSFSVYVKAVIQVTDPLTFYVNRNLDVDAYFKNLFTMDVRKITRKYSTLDYEGMDEELEEKLSAYNSFDSSTGFSYQVSVVMAEPGENAKEYVKKYSTQQLDMKLKENARGLTSSLAGSLTEALRTAVVEGRMTEEEAFQKIAENEDKEFARAVKRVETLRESEILTDEESKAYGKASILGGMPDSGKLLTGQASAEPEQEAEEKDGNLIDAMYDEEE